MKPFRIRRWALAAMLTFGALGPVSAQTTSESAPSPTARHSSDAKTNPKSPRVWTNDDITSLRTPADNYINKKANAKPESAAAQKIASGSAGSDQQKAAMDGSSLPDNADAAEKLIAKTEEDIDRKQSVLRKASTDAASAGSDLRRSELKSNEEIAMADLDASNDQLKRLQARLAQLKSKSAPEPNKATQPAP